MRLIDNNHLVVDIAKDDRCFWLLLRLDNHRPWSGTFELTLFKLGLALEWKV